MVHINKTSKERNDNLNLTLENNTSKEIKILIALNLEYYHCLSNFFVLEVYFFLHCTKYFNFYNTKKWSYFWYTSCMLLGLVLKFQFNNCWHVKENLHGQLWIDECDIFFSGKGWKHCAIRINYERLFYLVCWWWVWPSRINQCLKGDANLIK